ncbi:BLUF domain containing protein [Rhabdaerophilaceae bacterium]
MDVCMVYYSRAVNVSCYDTFAKDLKQIRDVSQKKNEIQGITGFLIYDEGYFSQVLEGQFSSVSNIFSSIENNKMHDNIEILSFTSIKNRKFSAWSMYDSMSDIIDKKHVVDLRMQFLRNHKNLFMPSGPIFRDLIYSIAQEAGSNRSVAQAI